MHNVRVNSKWYSPRDQVFRKPLVWVSTMQVKTMTKPFLALLLLLPCLLVYTKEIITAQAHMCG